MWLDAVRSGVEDLDALFAALDGRRVRDGVTTTTARVLAIHDDGRDWWIQFARGCDLDASEILRLSRCASISQASAALDEPPPAWLSWPRVTTVMGLVRG